MRSIRNSYSRLSDYEICQAIKKGSIRGEWMDKNDINNASLATDETASDIINKIDKSRFFSYNQ